MSTHDTNVTGPLVLGPMLRYVDETSAAVWVEVAERGMVSVESAGRTHEAHTFTVHGHHYALVDVTGLDPGWSAPYTVHMAGEQVWPPPDSAYPQSRIRTLEPGRGLRLVFGSCRTSGPHDAATNRAQGPDVLRAYAFRMARSDPPEWPSMALMLGDQVYADDTAPAMQAFIAARRDIRQPPGTELRDFEEYAHLYRLAWTDPANRWLLSTLSTAMIFDDHDIRDDWNTSVTWQRTMRATPWWRDRIVGGLASYWVYQHVGNLSPDEREADPTWREVLRIGRDGDAGEFLDAFAERADHDPSHYRWSFHRDLGSTRIVMLDTRAARVLGDDERRMLDETELAWFDDLLRGGCDHLLIGTSLPFMLPMGLHHVEAWNEALSAGAWGKRMARSAEWFRQLVDLEHWAAFQDSFTTVARAVAEVATGRRGDPPATVCFLSGDVHHSYLAEAEVGEGRAGSARLLQAVCSPIRNRLPRAVRVVSAVSARRFAWPMGQLAARTAKVPAPPFRWSVVEGPWFDNALATLEIDGRRARVRWDTAEAPGEEEPALRPLHSVTLT